jgi:hypothetical protein
MEEMVSYQEMRQDNIFHLVGEKSRAYSKRKIVAGRNRSERK